MIELAPGVRRLCVCVSSRTPGLLDSACRTAGFGRLYREYLDTDDVEIGFASPGVDEASLVTDLIAAMRAEIATENRPVAHGPALAAFHVGITRVMGNQLRGAAVARIRALLRDLAPAAGASEQSLLVVGISAGLFDDISLECGFTEGWTSLPTASAWFQVVEAGNDPGG